MGVIKIFAAEIGLVEILLTPTFCKFGTPLPKKMIAPLGEPNKILGLGQVTVPYRIKLYCCLFYNIQKKKTVPKGRGSFPLIWRYIMGNEPSRDMKRSHE